MFLHPSIFCVEVYDYTYRTKQDSFCIAFFANFFVCEIKYPNNHMFLEFLADYG